jgi:hypothetical protein
MGNTQAADGYRPVPSCLNYFGEISGADLVISSLKFLFVNSRLLMLTRMKLRKL